MTLDKLLVWIGEHGRYTLRNGEDCGLDLDVQLDVGDVVVFACVRGDTAEVLHQAMVSKLNQELARKVAWLETARVVSEQLRALSAELTRIGGGSNG